MQQRLLKAQVAYARLCIANRSRRRENKERSLRIELVATRHRLRRLCFAPRVRRRGCNDNVDHINGKICLYSLYCKICVQVCVQMLRELLAALLTAMTSLHSTFRITSVSEQCNVDKNAKQHLCTRISF
jgi:hypothetical protein